MSKWTVGDNYLDDRWPSGVAEIVDGSGYVVAYVPLHEGSSRNDERKHWPKRIVDFDAKVAELEAQLRQEREVRESDIQESDIQRIFIEHANSGDATQLGRPSIYRKLIEFFAARKQAEIAQLQTRLEACSERLLSEAEGRAVKFALREHQLQTTITNLAEALQLFNRYAPLSGDVALMVRACQSGGAEANERADKLIEFYEHLNEAHDKGREVIARVPKELLP